MTAVALKTKSDRSRLRGVALQIALQARCWRYGRSPAAPSFSPLFLPAPSAIAAAFYDTLLSGELPRQLGQTLALLSVGFGSRSSSGSRSGS